MEGRPAVHRAWTPKLVKTYTEGLRTFRAEIDEYDYDGDDTEEQTIEDNAILAAFKRYQSPGNPAFAGLTFKEWHVFNMEALPY